MVNENPLEIRPQDIVQKTADIVNASKSSPLDWLKQIKGALGQAKEIKDMLGGLGINTDILGGLLGGKAQGKPESIAEAPKGGTGITREQISNVVRLLMARYGDVPTGEMMAKIKDEFGHVKLSSFLQLFLGQGDKK